MKGQRPLRILVAVLAALFAYVLVTFAHRVLDITRGSPVVSLRASDAWPAIADARFPAVVSILGGSSLEPGHDIEILVSGEATFERLYGELRAARRSITFQPYYCGPGEVADSVAAILAERARSGARVHVVADGFGCRRFANRYGDALRRAGVELAVLRPVQWHTLHRAQHRSHVRVVVIDGVVAYTGGFGVDDKWLTVDGGGWRETNVRFTGPAVLQAQGAFIAAWAEATGELIGGEDLFALAGSPDSDSVADAPREAARPANEAAVLANEAGALAGVQFAGPGLGTTSFERKLFLSIAGARERLYITNSYFVPSVPLRTMLKAAARRGVDVRILTAGARTDVPTTLLAARAYYGDLLADGVRIYEYEPTMMHAKTFVVDGIWSAIGGMNLDNRSLRLNDELNLLVYDAGVGEDMAAIFLADLEWAVEVTLETYRRRPRMQRLLERGVRLIAPLL